MSEKVLKMIKDNNVKFVDFRFTDTKGKEQHVSAPAHTVDADLFKDGKMCAVIGRRPSCRFMEAVAMLGNSVQYSGMKHANYKSLILLLFFGNRRDSRGRSESLVR